MIVTDNHNLNYEKPLEIAEGVYWVGFLDEDHSLHCNPYLIIEGDEAVLIDGGSRTDFSTVMMKILRTGLNPSKIKALIYQHYDPDLCGSIPDFEAVIDNPDLKIISQRDNNVFIKYYGGLSPRLCCESLGLSWEFASGRRLEFIPTPYAHSPGSFMTFDCSNGVLFSSDLFGSFSRQWELFQTLDSNCLSCLNYDNCQLGKLECPLPGILNFHSRIMTSKSALNYALKQIQNLPVSLIAPQHGSLIKDDQTRKSLINRLENLNQVGIDRIIK